jgi:hypothetical protein
MFLEVVGDLFIEHGSLRIGGAEMDASPHSGVDDRFNTNGNGALFCQVLGQLAAE